MFRSIFCCFVNLCDVQVQECIVDKKTAFLFLFLLPLPTLIVQGAEEISWT